MIKYFLIVMALIAINANILTSQWIQTNGVFKGPVWTLISSGKNLFAGTYSGGVYLTTDAGNTWNQVNADLPTNASVTCFAMNENILYAGIGNRVYMTSNNGANWTKVDSGLPGTVSIEKLVSIGNKIIAGTNGAGIFVTTKDSMIWRAKNSGLPVNSNTYSLISKDSILFYGNDNGLYFSTDIGDNWIKLKSGITVGATSYAFETLYRMGNDIYTGNQIGVFRSSDNGANWTSINNSPYINTSAYSITGIGNNLFVGTGNDAKGVFLTTNNGNSWNSVSTGLLKYVIPSMTMCDTNIFCGTMGSSATIWRRPLSELVPNIKPSMKILPKSINYGDIKVGNHKDTTLSIENVGILPLVVSNVIIESPDIQISQKQFTLGFNELLIDSIKFAPTASGSISGKIIFVSNAASSYDTISVSANGVLTNYHDNKNTPLLYSLSQNYPNPFNPTTNIEFGIPRESFVRIIVFDMLGRQLRTLVDEIKSAGYYQITFDASTLSSGVYYYKIETKDFAHTRRLVLLR